MAQAPLPVPLGFPIVGVVGGEPFTSDGGWISKGFAGNVTVRLEGDSSGSCSVLGLETFRLEFDHDPDLPPGPHPRSWVSVDAVDGPGPIGVTNNTFLDITVGIDPAAPVPGVFQLSAVVVGDNGPLVSLPIEATSFSPAPVPPVIVEIDIRPTNLVTTPAGPESFPLVFGAFPTFSDGSTGGSLDGVIWRSTMPNVATISPEGLAVALADGVTTIIATFTTAQGRHLSSSTNLSVNG